MKVTVDIPDTLLEAARGLAAEEGKTVDALVEEGLSRLIGQQRNSMAFRLRDASFGKGGLQPTAGRSWRRIRDLIYRSPRPR